MNDKTKAELIKDNIRLKRSVRDLEILLGTGKHKSLWIRSKRAIRAFFKELLEV
jgi:hypothetical protein